MSVFDTANPPFSPDSDLDPDLTQEYSFLINSNTQHVNIAPGDWVDVNPSAMWPDPTWGLSFQVCNVYPEGEEVGILVLYDAVTGEYGETTLSAYWATNNFRRMPTT